MANSNIEIWLAFYQDILDESLLARLRELLNDEERCQEARFYFADDRKRYLVTRAMARTVLSQYAPVAPTEWQFSTNEYGRPAIANTAGRDLVFNISHTRGLIALGVTRDRALGVDVENLREREVSLDIADHFFSPAEVAALAQVAPERQQHRFFEYWTFKESYIKARGMGLSLPLDRFSFHYPHEQAVRIAIDPSLGDDAERWTFWQCQPTPDYLLAICADRSSEPAIPQVTLRKVVPTVSVEPFEFSFRRRSGAVWNSPASTPP